MRPSPTKLRGPSGTTSLELEDNRRLRSLSGSDGHDDHEIDVRSTSEAIEAVLQEDHEEEREEDETRRNEKRLASRQVERWRVAMINKSDRLKRQRAGHKGKSRDQLEFDNLFGTTSTFGQELQVVSYPWPLWVFGVVLMLGVSIFVLSVRRTRTDDDETPRNTTWWKYLVAIGIYVLGFALIASGKIETFYMDKHSAQLVVRSIKPLCCIARTNRTIERNLCHITNIRVECTGEYSRDVDTRTYRIHFDFDDGTQVSALESRSKPKTMRRCRHIKIFAAQSAQSSGLPRASSECLASKGKNSLRSPLRQVVTSPAIFNIE